MFAVFRATLFVVLIGTALFLLQDFIRFSGRAFSSVAPTFLSPLVPDLVAHLLLSGFVILLSFVACMDRDAMRRSGLPFDRRGLNQLLIGIAAGIVGMAVVVGMIAISAVFVVAGWKNAFLPGLAIAAVCTATYLLVGVGEELWFRGYAFSTMERAGGFWLAAIVSSLLFGFAHGHNPGENWGSELLIAAAGLFLCLLRRATGTLWYGIGLHAGFDYAQGVIFSGPDSGVDNPAEHLLRVQVHGPDWLTGGVAGYENSLGGAVVLSLMIGTPLALSLHAQRARAGILHATGETVSAG